MATGAVPMVMALLAMIFAAVIMPGLPLLAEIRPSGEITQEVIPDGILDGSRNTDNGIDPLFGKKVLGPGPHSTGDNTVDTLFTQVTGQKTMLMPRAEADNIVNLLAILNIHKGIGLATAKMLSYICSLGGNGYSSLGEKNLFRQLIPRGTWAFWSICLPAR